MLSKKSKIFIAGHKGMVGSSIQRKLKKLGYTNLLVIDKKKINLLDQKKVFNYLKKNKPSLVIIAAARVGGILANSKNKDSFLYENLQIQNNLIHGAYLGLEGGPPIFEQDFTCPALLMKFVKHYSYGTITLFG